MALIVLLRDMGCMQNALPIAKQLSRSGVDVAAFVEKGSVAEENFDGSLPHTDTISEQDVVLSCLPTETAFQAAVDSKAKVILIQENPDPRDYRFLYWPVTANVVAICTIVQEATGRWHKLTHVTGLPAVDTAADKVRQVDRSVLLERLNLFNASAILSMALPGDREGCERMLEHAKRYREDGYTLFARSHPVLERGDPEGYCEINKTVGNLSPFDLEWSNAHVNQFEQMALALGHADVFVGTHNTTMNWQAAAAGVRFIKVLPPADIDVDEWARSAPIITSGYGQPLVEGSKASSRRRTTLSTGHAVKNIMGIVLTLMNA